MIDIGPHPLWLPCRPAIIRAASLHDLAPPFSMASFLPGMFPAGAAAAAAAVPPSVSFRVLSTLTTDLTTYTFTAQDIGTAGATRKVVAAITGFNGTRTTSTVTIGGVSATKVVEFQDAGGTTALWIAAVPTGTTGDVVVTWSGAQVRCGCATWALYDLASATAVTTATSGADPAVLNVNVVTGDILIVAGCNNGGDTATPTGYTERYDTADAETPRHVGGDYLATSTETPRTVSINWSSDANVAPSVAAVFR